MNFEIKEMEFTDKYGERYVEGDFSGVIKDIILSEIKNYNQEEINTKKETIIWKIQGKEIYFSEDIKQKEYTQKVKSIYSVTKKELENIIYDFRENYVYKMALDSLVDDGILKLIHTSPRDNFYLSHGSILIDIRHRKGNMCLYVCSDMFNKNEYRVLK
ncbi:hypothetical protein [Clostridium sp. YIM B02555]|uniref:hypothetical protein n=1 Tax=Clostridium sp. YIM B02555 TaxID=2911968 RepID=UPI001EEDBD00|nr:hypothetical protein [Clostridium sp. YIM B02555]